MADLYSLENIVAERKEKDNETTEVEDEVNQKILEEAEKIERKNFQAAKAARMELEQAENLQRGTTEEIMMTGEKIQHAKRDALKIHNAALTADNLAEDIEDESRLFNIKIPFWRSIRKWWAGAEDEKREVSKIVEECHEKTCTIAESDETEVEYYSEPGQQETDAELKKILGSVRRINHQANIQKGLNQKQRIDLTEINRTNEYSRKHMEHASESLQRGLE